MNELNDLSSEFVHLQKELLRLRGDPAAHPDAAIVVPVNAQNDLTNVLRLLSDLAGYSNRNRIEIILVINNYPPAKPPQEIELYQQLGLTVVAIPHVEYETEVAVAARIPGIKVANSSNIILFDADCRIPNPTALLDWYIKQFDDNYDLAYTHVDYTDLPPGISVKARMFIHHAWRWFRRNILGTPTCRGSNYAVHKEFFLELFRKGRIPYELRVGHAVKANGGKVAYSGAKELVVLTSGRFFTPGWKVLFDYLIWRIRYYRQVLNHKIEKGHHRVVGE